MDPVDHKPSRAKRKTARATRADPLIIYDDRWIRTCTSTLDRFLSQHKKTLGIFFFMLDLVTKMDDMQAIAARALDGDKKPLDHYKKDAALKRLQDFSSVNSTNLVMNTANNFLCYLSEILQEVVRKRHEILKSGERLTTEEALQFSRFEDLVAFIADRKINELAYGGLRAMSDFVADRLGSSYLWTRKSGCWLQFSSNFAMSKRTIEEQSTSCSLTGSDVLSTMTSNSRLASDTMSIWIIW
jgi:hypothetical protein